MSGLWTLQAIFAAGLVGAVGALLSIVSIVARPRRPVEGIVVAAASAALSVGAGAGWLLAGGAALWGLVVPAASVAVCAVAILLAQSIVRGSRSVGDDEREGGAEAGEGENSVVEVNPYASPRAYPAGVEASLEARTIDPGPVAKSWNAGVAGLAFLVGVGTRTIRPMFPGPMHPDALIALALLVILCLALLIRYWRFPLRAGQVSLQGGLAGLWAAHVVGWSLVHGGLWDDLVGVSFVGWLVSAVAGAVLLLLPHRRYAARAVAD